MPLRLAMLLLFAVAVAARAQTPYAGAGTLADREGESHGWVVSPATGTHEAVVLHLPPRRERQDVGASEGGARLGAALPNVPQALAAWDQRLYMVFAPHQVGDGRLLRPVLIAGTLRGPIGGQWGPEHEGRRLPAAPSLPGEGRLIAFIGTRRGPVALMDLGRPGSPDHQLLFLASSAWMELDIPDPLLEQIHGPGESRHLSLVPRPDGFALLIVMPMQGNAVLWDADLSAGGAPRWSQRWLSLRLADGEPAPAPLGPVHWSGEHLVYAAPARSGTGLELWALLAHGDGTRAHSVWLLSHLPDVTSEWAAAPLDQVGRIAIVWADRIEIRSRRGLRIPDGEGKDVQPDGSGDAPAAKTEIRRYIAEVSILTGNVLYQGPLRMRGPVSTEELRLLAFMLVGLMIVVVVFVLRPEPKGPPLTLPPGYALAEPGRRISASAMDLLLAAFISGQVTGVSLWDLLTLRGIITPSGGGLTALFLLIAIGFVITTLGEWLAGRSPGKLIMGREVVRPVIDRTAEGQIVPSVQPATLWRIAVRNIVKWLLPPVAMAGLGTMEKRHRGDLAADTVVVIRIDEPEPA